jgi:hypothetical protein
VSTKDNPYTCAAELTRLAFEQSERTLSSGTPVSALAVDTAAHLRNMGDAALAVDIVTLILDGEIDQAIGKAGSLVQRLIVTRERNDEVTS